MNTNVNTSTQPNNPVQQTMRAVVLEAVNRLVIRGVAVPEPAAGEVIVRLRAAALNHRDLWIKQGEYAGLKFPIIPGSDGAGIYSSGNYGGTATLRVVDSVLIKNSATAGLRRTSGSIIPCSALKMNHGTPDDSA